MNRTLGGTYQSVIKFMNLLQNIKRLASGCYLGRQGVNNVDKDDYFTKGVEAKYVLGQN